jgi:hypothetical protein
MCYKHDYDVIKKQTVSIKIINCTSELTLLFLNVNILTKSMGGKLNDN